MDLVYIISIIILIILIITSLYIFYFSNNRTTEDISADMTVANQNTLFTSSIYKEEFNPSQYSQLSYMSSSYNSKRVVLTKETDIVLSDQITFVNNTANIDIPNYIEIVAGDGVIIDWNTDERNIKPQEGFVFNRIAENHWILFNKFRIRIYKYTKDI